MARLTWQNVNAPNFSGISDSYRVMSDLLRRATQSGQNALGIFQGAQEENADRAITQRLALAAQDPSQWDPASILGSDAGRASQAVLQDVADRPQWNANLLATRGQEQRAQSGEERVQTVFDNTQTDRTERRDARAAEAEYLLATLRGDPNAHRILEDPRLRALGGAGITSAIGYGQTGRSEADTVRNREIQEQARQMFPQLYASTVSVDDRNGMLGGMVARGEIAPEVASALGWDGGYGSTLDRGGTPSLSTAPTGSSVGNAPPNADPSRIMNYRAREQGISELPESVQTLGDFADWSKNQNRNGMKHTATGVYQIVGSNVRGWGNNTGYAEKVFGENWRNIPWSPESQDRIAEAIFNDHRGSAQELKGQWEGLTLAEANAIKDMPWEQAREVIARKESATSPAQILGQRSNPTSQLIQEYTDFYNRSNNLRQPNPVRNPQTGMPDWMTPPAQRPSNFVEMASAQAPVNPVQQVQDGLSRVDRSIQNAIESGRERPVTPEQMQQRIADYISPSFMEGEAFEIQEQMNLADPQRLHAQYQGMVASKKNELEVANEVVEQFPGWDASRIQREIARISKAGGVNPEQAGLLLQIARTDRRFWSADTWNLENSNFTWSKDDVEYLVNQVTTPQGERKLRMEQTAREELFAEQQTFYAESQRLTMLRDQLARRFEETRNPVLLQRIAGIDQQLNELGILNAQRVERNKRNPLLGLTRKIAGEATRVAPPAVNSPRENESAAAAYHRMVPTLR